MLMALMGLVLSRTCKIVGMEVMIVQSALTNRLPHSVRSRPARRVPSKPTSGQGHLTNRLTTPLWFLARKAIFGCVCCDCVVAVVNGVQCQCCHCLKGNISALLAAGRGPLS